MDCKINWTNKAWDSFEEIINYLITNWTIKVVNIFALTVDKKLFLLAKYPQLGSPKNPKQLNVLSTIIHKRIILIYKYKPLKNEIDLLLFWNTNQHPKKMVL